MIFVFLFFLTFFFETSLLEYDCFTMVCYFLLYNKVNQLYIYICSHISSLFHLPPSRPPYPTPLGGHKAQSSVNYSYHVVCYIPSIYLSYNWKFVPFDCFPPIPTFSTPASGNHKSDLLFYEFLFVLFYFTLFFL